MSQLSPGACRPFLRTLLVAAAIGVSACSTAPPAATVSVPVEALNPDVRPETINETICTAGYTVSVRPSTTYTNGVKRKLLRESGVEVTEAPKYELDHIIPLAIGGHPRNLRNLMLQPWDDATKKDRLEKQLQRLVCSRQLGLREAQAAIYGDWQAAHRRFVNALWEPRRAKPSADSGGKARRHHWSPASASSTTGRLTRSARLLSLRGKMGRETA